MAGTHDGQQCRIAGSISLRRMASTPAGRRQDRQVESSIFPSTRPTWLRRTDRRQIIAAVPSRILFYWTNIYHDRLYLLGFHRNRAQFSDEQFRPRRFRQRCRSRRGAGFLRHEQREFFHARGRIGRPHADVPFYRADTATRWLARCRCFHSRTDPRNLQSTAQQRQWPGRLNSPGGMGEGWSDYYARVISLDVRRGRERGLCLRRLCHLLLNPTFHRQLLLRHPAFPLCSENKSRRERQSRITR